MSILQIVIIIWFLSWTILGKTIYKNGIKTNNEGILKHYKKICVVFLVLNTVLSGIALYIVK